MKNITKKNWFLRMASALAVVMLLSVCVVSGTFAKYTSEASGSDTARVAYWGFGNSSVTFNLFDLTDSRNVQSSGSDKVIAPGTAGGANFAFAYTSANGKTAPEVAYTFTVSATAGGNYEALDANPNFQWALQKGSGSMTTYQTVSALLDAIKELSGAASGTMQYNAGQLPASVSTTGDYRIGWTWNFSGQDSYDINMGNASTLDNITITISITATQVD